MKTLNAILFLLALSLPYSVHALPPTCEIDGCVPAKACPPSRPYCVKYPEWDMLLCCLMRPKAAALDETTSQSLQPIHRLKMDIPENCAFAGKYDSPSHICPTDKPILKHVGERKATLCCSE